MKRHPLQDQERHRLLPDLPWKLVGRLHQAGTHLGGLVFGNEDHHLSEIVPQEPSGKPGLLRCQHDKDDLEYVGLPKLDLLGLKIHTALRKAGDHVSRKLGKKVDPLSPSPDDRQTYRLIRTGKNVGMFQLESPGQMEWEILGLNVSRHPLLPYRTALEDLGVTPSEEVKELPHGSRVRAAGLFECLQCPPTKSGRPVWFLLIEDEHGLLQTTIFRIAYERFGYLLHHRGTFLLEGRVEQDRRKGFSFVVERVGIYEKP